MKNETWFDGYSGETTEALLALADGHRIDSLVVAFDQAIQQKAMSGPISTEERFVLAIEDLEREVNNGGYNQLFLNSSNEYIDVYADALDAIGCPKTASITRQAIASLGLGAGATAAQVQAAAASDRPEMLAALEQCDTRFYSNDEPIADRLFAWIKANRARVRVGE